MCYAIIMLSLCYYFYGVYTMIIKMLKAVRKERKLNQEQVANAIGISRTAYSNYEQGTREPDISTLRKLCDCLDVSADFLIGRAPLTDSEIKAYAIVSSTLKKAKKHNKTDTYINILRELDNIF